jgi:hypothetical protein
MGDPKLRTETQSAHGKRVDSREDAIRCHRCPKSLGSHAVPNANFDQTTSSMRMTYQTLALEIGRLCLSLGKTD